MADSLVPFVRLEAALVEVGARLAFPPDEDVASAVAERLRTEPAGRRPYGLGAGLGFRHGRTLRRTVLLAAALLIVLAGVAVAAGFGIRGVQIIFSKTPPSVPPTAIPTGSRTSPLGASLSLGSRVSLGGADRRLSGSFTVLRPRLSLLGRPDEVYVDEIVPGGQATLVFGPRPGMAVDPRTGVAALITEFRGRLVRGPLLGKVVGPGTTVQEVTVNGASAIWISGAPHEVFFRDRDGRIVSDTVRLAGNVLLWERSGLTMRLESVAGRAEAIRIATSVR